MKFLLDSLKDLFKVFKYLLYFIFSLPSLIFFFFVLIIILIPIIILYKLFPLFFWQGQYKGIDLKSIADDVKININQANQSPYWMDILLSDTEFEHKITLDRKSFLSCAIDEKYYQDVNKCVDLINKKDGKVYKNNEVFVNDFIETFPDPKDNILFGKLDSVIFHDIERPNIYDLYEVTYSNPVKTSNASTQTMAKKISEKFIKRVYGKCKAQEQITECKLIEQGKKGYPFTSPSSSGFYRSDGFGYYHDRTSAEFKRVEFLEHTKFFGNPIAITNAYIKKLTSDEIILSNQYGSNTVEFIYQGDFGQLLETNGNFVYYKQPLATSYSSSFNFFVKVNGKYVSPNIFVKTKNFDFTIMKTDNPIHTDITQHRIIKKQASENLDLINQIEFKQPFEKILVTQLANVPGVSDGGASYHGAIDMIPLGNSGIDIKAAVSGVVVEHGYDNGCGYYVNIQHQATKIRTLYCHFAHIPNFSLNATVNIGDNLGQMGNTGISFGAHLHLQMQIPQNDGSYAWADFLHLLSDYQIQNSYQLDPKKPKN